MLTKGKGDDIEEEEEEEGDQEEQEAEEPSMKKYKTALKTPPKKPTRF